MFAIEALGRLLEYKDVHSVLDIGCGEQIHADIMREAGMDVTALSLTPPADLYGDYLDIGFDEKFDAIWASHVLEHSPNPGHFLAKCFEDLRDGGVLAVTVPPAKHEIVGGHVTLWNEGLLLVNLILMFVTGWLVLRRVPFGGIRLSLLDELLVFLLFVDLSATRIAIENGQITLLVFALMLITLLTADFAWPLAGIALGFALSKYSLAFPMFIFMLYKRHYRVILMAVLIQILGVLGLAALSKQSPVTIVLENIQLFLQHFNQPGIQLSRWFAFPSSNGLVSLIPALVMTGLVFLPLFFWLLKAGHTTAQHGEIVDFHLMTILFIWTLLLGYHRLYDTLILVFFIVLVFKGSVAPSIWSLASRGRTALWTFMLLLPAILILPARIVDLLLPFYYGRVSDFITTILLVIMLAISMFLLWRYLQNMQLKITHKETDSHELRNDPYRDTQPRWAHHS